jgi:hypothetical protein
MDPNSSGRFRYLTTVHVRERSERPSPVSVRISPVSVTMKARQSSKIRELAEAVESAGFLTLDEQARALGVPRSTAWTIRRASHKASGLTASIINRMLTAPQLPPLVRSKILEYVEEKAAGFYGGSQNQLRNFVARLSIKQLPYREPEAKFPEAKGMAPTNCEKSRATDEPEKPLDFRANHYTEA